MKNRITIIIAAILVCLVFAGCASVAADINVQEKAETSVMTGDTGSASSQHVDAGTVADTTVSTSDETVSEPVSEAVTATANVTSTGMIDATDLFTNRDLKQTADTTGAVYYSVTSNSDITISAEGVYVITGTASESTIIIDADDEDKIQLVLDGVSITNSDFPAIYVKNADKVFITTTASDSYLTVTGTFASDGSTNTDAVIFSKDDMVINGTGTLTISSTAHGITCKDDLKITGSTIKITSGSSAIQANDSIAVAAGELILQSTTDGLHAENDSDSNKGYIYICGGTITITAGDDGIHAVTVVQIDGGEISITAAEGIEGTYIQINDGTINISASDDGINGAKKTNLYTPTVEINGGYITIKMGQGDTDSIDSNGYIYVNGGTVDITGQSSFDYDINAEYNGGTIIVNGQTTNTITNQFGGMGPGGMGQGGFGGFGGFGGR